MMKNRLYVYAGNVRAGGAMKRLRWELHFLSQIVNLELHVRISENFLIYIKNTDEELLKNIRVYITKRTPFQETLYWSLFYILDYRFYKIRNIYSPTGLLPLFKIRKSFSVISPSSVIPFERRQSNLKLSIKTKIRRLILRLLVRRSVRKADALVLLSSYMKELTAPYVSHQKIHMSIHPTYPDENVTIKTNYEEVCHGQLNLVYVSHIADYKDQLWLVDQIAEITKVLQKNICLTFVGDIQTDVRAQFEIKLGSQFEFLELRHIDRLPFDKLDDVYNEADCVLFGSKSENSPHTLLEGIERGIPIICRDREFNRYYLHDKGLYYDDYSSLMQCIETINAGPERRRLIGEDILQLIERHKIADILSARCKFIMEHTSSHV